MSWPAAMTVVQVWAWDGSAWVAATVRSWDGATWTTPTITGAHVA